MKSLAISFGALLTCAVAGSLAGADTESGPMQVRGTFEVKLDLHEPDNPAAEAAGLMRMSLDKTFHGALDATANGVMMAHGDGTDSGAYVAIETVEGTLDGRRGSFALVHMATMRATTPEYWSIRVIPDSGAGELEGIEGEMTITIDEDGHHYEFSYRLP